MKRLLLFVPILLACGPFFYQAPPSLAHYPDRIPTKDWREILDDDQPGTTESRLKLIKDLRTFTSQFTSLEKEEQLARTEEFIERNRKGHFAISVANFLLELRELCKLEIPPAELQRYLNWRSHDLPPPSAPRPPVKHWGINEEEFQKKRELYRNESLAFLTSHDDRVETASGHLKPYHLVQRGGMFFRAGYPKVAEIDFQDVVDKFPDHPRAEIARFMLARNTLLQLRKLKPKDFDNKDHFLASQAALVSKTEKAFAAYLKKHPGGRFVNDAYGWLGGLARDQKNHRKALNLQIQRLKAQPTREVTAGVLRECDKIFTEFFESASNNAHATPFSNASRWIDLDFNHLADCPIVARLFVSHTLDPIGKSAYLFSRENTSGDRRTLDFLHRRVIAPAPFNTAALSQLGQAIVRRSSTHDATSLLILGWAATRQGDHAQALELFNLGLNDEVTDELIHAKAVALTRLERNAEAAVIFQKLLDDFPESPLSLPSRFDLALALLHSGQAGHAFLTLHQKNDTPSLRPANEAPQWIDHILQFSPLPELRAALTTLSKEHPSLPLLRRAISLRSLCLEDFQSAREHLIPTEDSQIRSPLKRRFVENYFDLTPARWQSDIAPLAEAMRKLRFPALPSGEKARLHLQIGRLWKTNRGKITFPLHHLTDYSNSETDLADQLRHDNARHLGLTDSAIEEALLSRDELSHALKHFLAAAELDSTPEVTAAALEEANEALFRMAEVSPYRAALAVKNNHTKLSGDLVNRLRTSFPNQPESARSLPYNFLPPLLLGDWMPGDRAGWIADKQIAALFDQSDQETDLRTTQMVNSLRNLAGADGDLSQIRNFLTKFEAEFEARRPRLTQSTIITVGGHIDDLQLVAQHSGITAELFREYLPLRLSDKKPANLTDSPLSPFIDFLIQARLPREDQNWPAYLTQYPDSPKSEAIALRLLRAQIRPFFPVPHVSPVFFPDAPRTLGYKTLRLAPTKGEQVDAKALLDEHRKKHPSFKYQRDVDLLQAAIAAHSNDYPVALDLLSTILNDPRHPELHQDASLQFAEISLRLLDPRKRSGLVEAFRENPAALAILEKLAHGGTCVSRIRPLLPALSR